MIDPLVPPSIRQHLQKEHAVTHVRATDPGMSGANVFRCTTSDGREFALKRWTDSTSRERVMEIHQVLVQARGNGCIIAPEAMSLSNAGTTVAMIGDRCWDLLTWMCGRPLSENATLQQIRSGAAAIASFHRAVRPLGERLQQAPTILARLRRINELDRSLSSALSADGPALDQLVIIRQVRNLLREKWPSVRQEISRSLLRYANDPVMTQYVLRDVHRQHVLWGAIETREPSVDPVARDTMERQQQEMVTGLIDFDAIRIDWPITDLVRWGGSFVAHQHTDEEVWDAVLAGYSQDWPSLSGSEWLHFQQIASDLQPSSTWISLANWAIWVLAESRTFPCGAAVIEARIEELLRQAIIQGDSRI